jgi:alpha-tubulin suppressor-like RCC1 family protein
MRFPRCTGAALLAALCLGGLSARSGAQTQFWGWGYGGGLGLGPGAPNQWVPARIPVNNVESFTSGLSSPTIVRTTDGRYYGWGANNYGQLALPPSDPVQFPTELPLSQFSRVLANNGASFGVTPDGLVYAWGFNGCGQLGQGDLKSRPTPTLVPLPGPVAAFWAKNSGAFAKLADGRLFAWGYCVTGALGVGIDGYVHAPTEVPLAGVVAITGFLRESYMVTDTGDLYACGENNLGQLGVGDRENRLTPTRVPLAGVIQVAPAESTALVVTADGSVYGMGSNYGYALGLGTDQTWRVSPVALPISGVTQLANGGGWAVARRVDGSVYVWGSNGGGQLGLGDTTARPTPTLLGGIPSMAWVSASWETGFAMTADHRLFAWGGGATESPRLGLGQGRFRNVPEQVALGGIQAFYGDYEHTYVCVTPGLETKLYCPDRSQTITESVALKGYLYRKQDSVPIAGKPLVFRIDGAVVGTADTDAGGQAVLNWTVTAGASTRTLTVAYDGNIDTNACRTTAVMACKSYATKTYMPDRAGKIATAAALKGYLFFTDNKPIRGKTLELSVDGSVVGSAATDANGQAVVWWTIPEGAGAGQRPLKAAWVGNAGYTASSGTAKLTVSKAPAYLWLASRSIAAGSACYLRAYLRRLPDYVWLPGKEVAFTLDGTEVGRAATNTAGCSSVLYNAPAGMATGAHPLVAAFGGDGAYEPDSDTGALTVVP